MNKLSLPAALASKKFTVILFIAIATFAFLGTIIPQESRVSAEVIKKDYHHLLYAFFSKLELFRLYHSFWFKVLFLLLFINLTGSTIISIPKAIKTIKPPKNIPEPQDFSFYPFNRLLSLPDGPSLKKIEETLMIKLKQWGFKPEVEKTGKSHLFLFVTRSKIGRFGLTITYLGLIILLLGAFLSSYYAIRGRIDLVEGEMTSTMMSSPGAGFDLPFSIALNQAKAFYYPSEMIKEWEARTSILVNGKKKVEETLRINHPLRFQGFYLLPDEFSENAKTKIRGYSLEISGLEGENKRRYYIKNLGEELEYKEEGLKIIPLRFIPDFIMSGTTAFTRSEKLRNPALEIKVIPKTGEEVNLWIFANYPELNRLPGLPVVFFFQADTKELSRVGFEVVRDPGINIVFSGGVLLSAGIFISFFLNPASLSILLLKKDRQILLIIGGDFPKDRFFLERGIEELMEKLRRGVN
jgi:cytochrome c biogenesis protein